MGTYLSAARAAGARKQRQPLPEAPSDSEYPVGAPPRTPRGLRPCDPAENQSQNLSKKENHEAVCALPLEDESSRSPLRPTKYSLLLFGGYLDDARLTTIETRHRHFDFHVRARHYTFKFLSQVAHRRLASYFPGRLVAIDFSFRDRLRLRIPTRSTAKTAWRPAARRATAAWIPAARGSATARTATAHDHASHGARQLGAVHFELNRGLPGRTVTPLLFDHPFARDAVGRNYRRGGGKQDRANIQYFLLHIPSSPMATGLALSSAD